MSYESPLEDFMSYRRVKLNQRYRWICEIHHKSQMRFHINNKTILRLETGIRTHRTGLKSDYTRRLHPVNYRVSHE